MTSKVLNEGVFVFFFPFHVGDAGVAERRRDGLIDEVSSGGYVREGGFNRDDRVGGQGINLSDSKGTKKFVQGIVDNFFVIIMSWPPLYLHLPSLPALFKRLKSYLLVPLISERLMSRSSEANVLTYDSVISVKSSFSNISTTVSSSRRLISASIPPHLCIAHRDRQKENILVHNIGFHPFPLQRMTSKVVDKGVFVFFFSFHVCDAGVAKRRRDECGDEALGGGYIGEGGLNRDDGVSGQSIDLSGSKGTKKFVQGIVDNFICPHHEPASRLPPSHSISDF